MVDNVCSGTLQRLKRDDLDDIDPDGENNDEALDKLDILRARLDKIEAFLVDFGWP